MEHCPKCGYPRALVGRLHGPVPSPAEFEDMPSPAAAGPSVRAPEPARPEAEVNAALARDLEQRTELLLMIDRDAPDVTGELCEAALSEASGRAGEAQQVLRSAQGRLERETEELLSRHLESLEARGRALQATGLRLALEDELGRLAESMVSGDAAASVAALAAAEHRMDGLETHWSSLQGLIAQVTVLREQAADLGIRLEGLPDRLAAARATLASMVVTDHDLDIAAQAASETLMQLHEAIPPALESELKRHAEVLQAHHGRPPKLQTARRRHAEAVEHLKSGRLEDAVRSVHELRVAIGELAKQAEEVPAAAAPAVRAPPTAPPLAPPHATRQGPEAPASGAGRADARPARPAEEEVAPPDPAVIEALVMKARSLAVRVRALPADSVEANQATRQVQQATELLRLRRYAEADAALSRLMRALVDVGSRS